MRCVCLLHVSYEYCYMYAIRTLYIIIYVIYVCYMYILCMLSPIFTGYELYVDTIKLAPTSFGTWSKPPAPASSSGEKKKISTVGLTMALVKNKTSRFHIVDTYYCNQALFCCDRNNTQQQICGNRSWHWEIFGGHGVAGKFHELYWKNVHGGKPKPYLIISSSIPGYDPYPKILYVYDGLSKCMFPVLLINRNSMRAASCLPLKNMTYLDDVKTWKFFIIFGNLSKTTGIG